MYENNNDYNIPETNPVPPTPVYTAAPATDPDVDALVDSAFGKSLAAAIMCEFPIASIIAIIFGFKGASLAAQAKTLATQRGVRPGGKNIAATILGKIGGIVGIIMSVFWLFYLFLIIFIFSNI